MPADIALAPEAAEVLAQPAPLSAFAAAFRETRGAMVGLELVEEVKAKKVIAYKYRKREGYHRTVGHRQKLSRVKITAITI